MSDKCWESDLAISENDKCPHITRATAPKIIIPSEIWHKIMGLTQELDTEWLGYLGASFLKTGEWRVTDITVPKQEVSAASVKPTETLATEGVIHSHVDMGAFFSGIDDSYLNENHNFSIVVNKKGETKAVVRLQLPCGALTIIDTEVEIEVPEYDDAKDFIKEAKKNIEAPAPICCTPTWKWNPTTGFRSVLSDDEKKDEGVPDYEPKKKSKKKQYSAWDPNDAWNDYWDLYD